MARIAILGAGFMGSALSIPATDNGHQVALWGTWLDDHIVESLRGGLLHPKLKMALPPGVTVYAHRELAEALDGANLVVSAVNSEGVLPVLGRAAPHLRPQVPLLSVSKGLVRGKRGRIVTLSTALREALPSSLARRLRLVTVGGPSKAVELARRVPTAVVYASRDSRARRFARRLLQTEYYAITESSEQTGLEICSALKNAYSIAVGICDGLIAAGKAEAMFNTKSALFAQALVEMERVGRLFRASPAMVRGLGGAGDLHVTSIAGRNRTFGELLGRGMAPEEVVATLKARDELTEGYPAIKIAYRLTRERRVGETPLLRALYRIAYEGRPAEPEIMRSCFPRRRA